MYEKYLEIKKKYKDQIIFIKSGKFYSTFDDDSLIINNLFGYKIISNKVGFPINCMFKIKGNLIKNKLGYCILEGNDIIENVLDKNNYKEILEISLEKYEKEIQINEIMEEIKNKLNKDFSFYDKLIEYLNNLQ